MNNGTETQIDPVQKQVDGRWYWPDSYGYRIALEAENERLREELVEARDFIIFDYCQYEKFSPYAHELRSRFPWLEAAAAASATEKEAG